MYLANANRYKSMKYNRCGKSGLMLPAVSLGLWHNFGDSADINNCKKLLCYAFDNGITHFDLANNYGPIAGSAEINFGKIFKSDLASYRDEIIVSSKAGYYMHEGPYGEWGSRKYMLASLDASLKRTGLDYFDIFYSHRPDPNTPIEETAGALDSAVRQGKALYVGISNYSPEQTESALKVFNELRTPFIIHQPSYNMFDRWIENGLCEVLIKNGIGCIVFSPLAQGLLSDRYINGIPADSRAMHSRFLNEERVNLRIEKVKRLNAIAKNRGQTLAQTALSWCLSNPAVTSVLIGASNVEQIKENLQCLKNTDFTDAEKNEIIKIADSN